MLPTFLTAAWVFKLLTMMVIASPPHLLPRQTTVTDLPGLWAFNGCYEDNPPSERSLTGASFVDATGMTVEACVNFCNNKSFIYAGLEFGQECYCDNIFENIEESVGKNECSQACVGNPAELCGAANRLSVYTSGTAAVFPTLVTSVGPWIALGCYSDSTSARTLQMRVNAGVVTVESCTAACFSQGFTLAGLEFGSECWCGSQVLNGGAFVGNDNGISGAPPVRQSGGPYCDMACAGNSNELCGGSNRMDLYNYTGSTTATFLPSVGSWLSLGCFVDAIPERTFRTQVFPNVGVTAETCTAACLSAGFTLAGLEFGLECWCDTTFASPSGAAPASACAMPCAANSFEICGGPLALTVYQFQNVAPILSAFATLNPPTNALTTLINSITSSNLQTIGPQIAPGLQNLASSVSTASSQAGSAVNSGRNPVTGTNAAQVVTALQSFAGAVSSLSRALSGESSLLSPGFATPILSGIEALNGAADHLTQVMANEVIPSRSAEALSSQTSFDESLEQAASAY